MTQGSEEESSPMLHSLEERYYVDLIISMDVSYENAQPSHNCPDGANIDVFLDMLTSGSSCRCDSFAACKYFE